MPFVGQFLIKRPTALEGIVGKIAVRVADDQRRELKRLAQQTQFSRSDLVRIAINKLLENPEWLPGWVAERSQERAGA
jgi:predicted transcriptional regulator